MFKHLIKIAIRNFLRYKSFSFINIFGLSFGLATFILIALYVQYEFSWDKFHAKHERIYRLQPIAHMADGDEYWDQVGFPVGGAIKGKYPEIEQSVVTRPVWGEYLSSSEKLTFHENDGQYAEQSFFDVFTTEFIEGTPEAAPSEPYSIVLRESLKEKYFKEVPDLKKFIKVKESLFDFHFVGENIDEGNITIYNGIVKTSLFFSLITILISAGGMFGLVAFSTKSRTKEIGISKIYGALTGQIFKLISMEFHVLIIIAIVLSFPAGIAFKTIDPAAYKAETEIWEYLFTGGLVLLITFFTISYHTQKASSKILQKH